MQNATLFLVSHCSPCFILLQLGTSAVTNCLSSSPSLPHPAPIAIFCPLEGQVSSPVDIWTALAKPL